MQGGVFCSEEKRRVRSFVPTTGHHQASSMQGSISEIQHTAELEISSLGLATAWGFSNVHRENCGVVCVRLVHSVGRTGGRKDGFLA